MIRKNIRIIFRIICVTILPRRGDTEMREGRFLEFKSEVSASFLKTVSAFANFGDGKILFGVDDTGKQCGVANPDAVCLDIENRINDSIKPKPDYRLAVNRRSGIITLTVEEGAYKPYLYKAKAYKRNDTATVEVDSVELKRLILEGSNIYFEQLTGNNQQPCFSVLEQELQKKLAVDKLTADILRTLDLCSKDLVFNNAAELLSDVNNFPGVDIARFGNSISEIFDRETIAGVSVLIQFNKTLELFKRYYQFEKIEGAERKLVEVVPETAFREALANALVHRTWDVAANVRIAMYSDKIEISSPGGLPSCISKENYLQGRVSFLRNPILGGVFFRLHYIEKFGTGIRRIMEAYKFSYSKPLFEVTDSSVTIVLPAVETENKLISENEKIVLSLLSESALVSSRKIAEQSGFSKIKTVRILNKLLEKSIVSQVGNGRNTAYRLKV